jgi:hypothetical protein
LGEGTFATEVRADDKPELRYPILYTFPRLLRLDGERRGEEAARNAGDEGAPIHHSST